MQTALIVGASLVGARNPLPLDGGEPPREPKMLDLTQQDELIIQQRVEMLEAVIGIESRNKYAVLTPDGEQIFYAYETSNDLARIFLKGHRGLEIHVVDSDGAPVLTADRAFFWFRPEMNVRDGDGRYIGTLNRQWGFLTRKITMTDSAKRGVGLIRGKMFPRPFTFFIDNPQGVEVGRITKEWSGFGRELFTDADTFRIEFGDAERSQETRLMLLAAAFAIDLDFFER